MISEGFTAKQIATQYECSFKTIEAKVLRLKSFFGYKTSIQLVMKFKELKFI
jgi:DNA-binding NarL/FixJ family response regulator